MILICLKCRQPYLTAWYEAERKEYNGARWTGRYQITRCCPAVCPECGGLEVAKR